MFYSNGDRDYVSIGCSPAEEECVQVESTGSYYKPMMEECRRYCEFLNKRFPDCDKYNCVLRVKTFPHDFGTYAEVVCWYDTEDEESSAYAYIIEGNSPGRWNETEVFEGLSGVPTGHFSPEESNLVKGGCRL